ncbi:uncharacterized protein LOC127369524 isoform X2 [Dicentrarchus labrax]|uniref:Interleukin-7 n=1 Tax=Dicentrarchus labrax TaxID=13489 RepID=A0A8P4KB97_DICLA|nr:uncharacterized protein LOC127369524 isoform X2 [Dicentrarchus labrax]
MPLLCISLLFLLLLPLSLSCDRKRPPTEVKNDYAIVQIYLQDAKGKIVSLLHNSSCTRVWKHKQPNCTSGNMDVVSTLHKLACKMKNLELPDTDKLARSVINSIQCPCQKKPTEEPNAKPKRRRTATRKRRNEPRKSKETRKLCKTKAVLSSMTTCYEMLNTMTA